MSISHQTPDAGLASSQMQASPGFPCSPACPPSSPGPGHLQPYPKRCLQSQLQRPSSARAGTPREGLSKPKHCICRLSLT